MCFVRKSESVHVCTCDLHRRVYASVTVKQEPRGLDVAILRCQNEARKAVLRRPGAGRVKNEAAEGRKR